MKNTLMVLTLLLVLITSESSWAGKGKGRGPKNQNTTAPPPTSTPQPTPDPIYTNYAPAVQFLYLQAHRWDDATNQAKVEMTFYYDVNANGTQNTSFEIYISYMGMPYFLVNTVAASDLVWKLNGTYSAGCASYYTDYQLPTAVPSGTGYSVKIIVSKDGIKSAPRVSQKSEVTAYKTDTSCFNANNYVPLHFQSIGYYNTNQSIDLNWIYSDNLVSEYKIYATQGDTPELIAAPMSLVATVPHVPNINSPYLSNQSHTINNLAPWTRYCFAIHSVSLLNGVASSLSRTCSSTIGALPAP